MRVTTFGRAAKAAAATLLFLPALLWAAPAQAAPPAAPVPSLPCSGTAKIEKKLPGGTNWRMCWRVDQRVGMVLEKVSYQPKRETKPIPVLSTGHIAEINVPYDSGRTEYYDVAENDLGGGNIQNLMPKECPGGTLRSTRIPDRGNVRALCVTTRPAGHAWRDDGWENARQQQATDLVVFSISTVGWYVYINEWTFSEDGKIKIQAGATGNLSGGDYSGSGDGWPIGKNASDYATSHYHSIFWRLNFADGANTSSVEQYDTAKAGAGEMAEKLKTTKKTLTTEAGGNASLRRWWRVVSPKKNSDGHRRSWELVQGPSSKYDAHAFTKNDVYFTQYRPCERLAAADKSYNETCRGMVDKWVNGERLTKPVAWVNSGFHHIARDEDQTPMPAHWQGFQLVPRDVTNMSPLTPQDLLDQNGRPDGEG